MGATPAGRPRSLVVRSLTIRSKLLCRENAWHVTRRKPQLILSLQMPALRPFGTHHNSNPSSGGHSSRDVFAVVPWHPCSGSMVGYPEVTRPSPRRRVQNRRAPSPCHATSSQSSVVYHQPLTPENSPLRFADYYQHSAHNQFIVS